MDLVNNRFELKLRSLIPYRSKKIKMKTDILNAFSSVRKIKSNYFQLLSFSISFNNIPMKRNLKFRFHLSNALVPKYVEGPTLSS